MRVDKKRKRVLILFILFTIVFVLGVFLFSNLIDYLSILEKQELYARVIVSDHYGVDVNSSALIFGMITPGSSSVRKVSIRNEHNQDINVEIFVKGNIQEFMQISENDFNLKVNETKEIVFLAIAPKDKEFGIYEGGVVVSIKNIIIK